MLFQLKRSVGFVPRLLRATTSLAGRRRLCRRAPSQCDSASANAPEARCLASFALAVGSLQRVALDGVPSLIAGAVLSLSAMPALAAGAAPNEPADAKSEAVATPSALAAAAADFKSQPNDLTWQALSQAIKTLLGDSKSARVPYAQLEKANHELGDLGLKVMEAGSAELWTFPRIPQAREMFVRWQEAKPSPPARRRKPAPPASVLRVQAIVVPASIEIKEAKVVDIGAPRAATAPAPAQKDKKPAAATSTSSTSGGPKTEGGRFLIMSGADRATSVLWIKSFKLVPEGWRENSQPLSGIPPFLLTKVSGKLAFSGADLLLTIRPGVPKAPATATGNGSAVAVAESPSHRLALRLVNGRYALEGRPVPDTPFNTVYQFVQALSQGRLDAAKGWLSDQKLISVARYVGLSNKAPASQLRIINMAGPPPAVYRFRFVTFERNDLILDVAKTKTTWAIKAIFIAPADPLIQQIARGLPPLEPGVESFADDAAAKTPAGGTAQPKPPLHR